jgi:hypothetical protein
MKTKFYYQDKKREEINREWIRLRQAFGAIRQPPDELTRRQKE